MVGTSLPVRAIVNRFSVLSALSRFDPTVISLGGAVFNLHEQTPSSGVVRDVGEDLATARRKLVRARELLREQQYRVDRQRELIARLETDTTNLVQRRSAQEALRQLIKTHEALLREVAAAQERAEVRLLERNRIDATRD